MVKIKNIEGVIPNQKRIENEPEANGYGICAYEIGEVELVLDEEETIKIISEYFINLGKRVTQARFENLKEKVRPARGLTEKLSTDLPKLLKVKK